MSRNPQRTLKCSNCGVNLPLEEGQKVVVCEYCSTHTAVPPELWKPEPAPVPVHPSVHRSQPVPAAGSGKSPAVVVAIVIALVVAGSGAALYFVTSGGGGGTGVLSNTVRGDVVGLVEASAVVPSFEAVDGIETARSISATVEKRWRPHGRTSVVSFTKVNADGSMNISGDAESHISMTFYDTDALGNVVPGQTSAKGAQITLSVINDYVAGFEGYANLTWADDIVYIDEYPSCDLKTLRRKAAGAGYPDAGFANVTFPEVPGELTKDGLDFALSFVRKDGDALKKKLEAMDWDTGPYRFYQFYVPSLDASDLPRYFRPDDCSPVDVKKLQEELIESLRRK